MRDAFRKRTARVAFIVFFAALLCIPFPGWAGTVLGSAQNFAVLGYAGVTNVPAAGTKIFGDVGVSPLPLTSITGLSTVASGTTGLVIGGIYGPVLIANQAKADITTAYDTLAGLSFTSNITGQNLGGLTLTPGVYFMSNPALLTGNLILNASGDPNAHFVFQLMNAADALTTASGSSVTVTGGNANTEVYWVLGSSADLGSGSTFAGNILAYSKIALQSTAKIECGRAFSLNESVTLDNNLISGNCSAQAAAALGVTLPSDVGSLGFSGGTSGGGIQPIPEPGTLTLLGMSLGAGFLLRRKFRPTR